MRRALTGLPVFVTLLVLMVSGCSPASDSGPAAAEQAQRYETTIVPVVGGLGMMVVLTDHEAGKTYLYAMPRRTEDPTKLIATIDLTTAGDRELGLVPADRPSPATAPATRPR